MTLIATQMVQPLSIRERKTFTLMLVAALATVVAFSGLVAVPTAAQVEHSAIGVVVPDAVSDALLPGTADAGFWDAVVFVYDSTQVAVAAVSTVVTLASCPATYLSCGLAAGSGAAYMQSGYNYFNKYSTTTSSCSANRGSTAPNVCSSSWNFNWWGGN